MTELNETHEAVRSAWCERIMARIRTPIAKVAIAAAEYVGEKQDFDIGDYEENWE